MAEDSSSQCGGSSPVPRSFHARKFDRSRLCLAESISKMTLDNVPIEEVPECTINIKPAFDDFFVDTRPKLRKNARLSTIASLSPTGDYPSQAVIRECRSLDPFPSNTYDEWLKEPKIYRSLENCVKFTWTNSKTDITGKVLDSSYPNGNVIMVPNTDDSSNEAEMPLLGDDDDSCVGEILSIKNSRTSDQEISGPSTDNVPDKKSSTQNSLIKGLLNMLNGTGLRSSEVYLGKGMERYEMQSERESIV